MANRIIISMVVTVTRTHTAYVLFQLFHSLCVQERFLPFYLGIERKSIICRLYFDLFPMKLNHVKPYTTLFYSFNTNTFIIRRVCETQCGCQFYVVVGVPILCASDLISFAYHLIIWHLIHRNWKWCCLVLCYIFFLFVLRCDVQQCRKWSQLSFILVFSTELSNGKQENVTYVASKTEYKRKLNHILQT